MGSLISSRRRIVGVAISIGIILLTVVAQAAALEDGTLTQLPSPHECVGETFEEPALCAGKITKGMTAAYEIQVSPEDNSAYSVAIGSPGDAGALVEYSRDELTGALTVVGCLTASSEPCSSGENVQTEVDSIEHPSAVAVSPDGRDVYVLGQERDDLVELERDTSTGLLRKIGCYTSETATTECPNEIQGLATPYDVIVSPDGKNVYVTSYFDEDIAEFTREASGELTPIAGHECIGEDCPDSAVGLRQVIGLAISPSEKDIYAAAGGSGANEGDVAAFERNATTGALEQLPGKEACIGEGVAGCEAGVALAGTESLVVAPDDVYASSFTENAVAELKIGSSGQLEEPGGGNDCVTTETIAGCKTVTQPLGGPLGVAISPDHENLYVSSNGQASIDEFEIESGGELVPLAENEGCVTTGLSGCSPDGAGLIGLQGARRLTVSPDNVNVYVAGQGGDDVVELARTVKPTILEMQTEHARVEGLAAGSEAGGVPLQITGEGFTAGSEVEFGVGGASPEVTVHSSTSLTAITPAGAASHESVHVDTDGGESKLDSDSEYDTVPYGAPTVTGLEPGSGPETVQNTLVVRGSEFKEPAEVRFGAATAVSAKVLNGNKIEATAPRGAGMVNVTVKTAKGLSPETTADEYEYYGGGLNLAGYCESLGYRAVTLLHAVEGPEYAYDNWACVSTSGADTSIANAGAAPSMADACAHEYVGVTTYAWPESSDNAYTWNCHVFARPELEAERKPSPKSASPTHPGTTATIAASKPVPPPVLAVSGDVAPVSGKVYVLSAGSKTRVSLTTLTSIPFGSTIDATDGRVLVTVAGPHGSTMTGEFFGGEFVLRQGENGVVVAELTGGDFAVCPTAAERAHKASARISKTSGKHVVRKLWSDAHGSFSTKGNYASGAVAGTEWLTEDLCEGTLIKVTRDKVKVTSLVDHHSKIVQVGHKELVKAPPPRHRR